MHKSRRYKLRHVSLTHRKFSKFHLKCPKGVILSKIQTIFFESKTNNLITHDPAHVSLGNGYGKLIELNLLLCQYNPF